jgi:cysteine desulfurase
MIAAGGRDLGGARGAAASGCTYARAAMTTAPRTVYLDHAASTPMLPEAVAAMTALLGEVGNPSSLHASGRTARRHVEEARETVAAALGARPSEVLFTGGGTESDNLAVKGLYWQRRKEDPARRRILASAVEHHAVMDAVLWLTEHQGATVEWLPVDRTGRVRPETLEAAIASDPGSVSLVTVMWANNEVGTVQPIAELAAVASSYGIPVHSDAVQALGSLPVDFAASGLDAMTVTGHKIGGPLGVGVLVLGRTQDLVPVLHGGGQERDVRSGTLDTPAIVALATAAELAVKRRCEHAAAVAALRDDLVRRVREVVPDVVLGGDPDLSADRRLPGNAHFSFPGCEGDALLLLLDAQGIEVSTGSACSAGVPQPSHVLLAMGVPEDLARGSLRFSFGHTSTATDVDAVVAAIGPVVERARRAGRTGGPKG